jgi:hypothetical protein
MRAAQPEALMLIDTEPPLAPDMLRGNTSGIVSAKMSGMELVLLLVELLVVRPRDRELTEDETIGRVEKEEEVEEVEE